MSSHYFIYPTGWLMRGCWAGESSKALPRTSSSIEARATVAMPADAQNMEMFCEIIPASTAHIVCVREEDTSPILL